MFKNAFWSSLVLYGCLKVAIAGAVVGEAISKAGSQAEKEWCSSGLLQGCSRYSISISLDPAIIHACKISPQRKVSSLPAEGSQFEMACACGSRSFLLCCAGAPEPGVSPVHCASNLEGK